MTSRCCNCLGGEEVFGSFEVFTLAEDRSTSSVQLSERRRQDSAPATVTLLAKGYHPVMSFRVLGLGCKMSTHSAQDIWITNLARFSLRKDNSNCRHVRVQEQWQV